MAGLLSSWLHKMRTNRVVSFIKGDVLDLACGPATGLGLAGDRINKYYGVEYDLKTVELLRVRYPEAKFFQKDLDEDFLDFDIKFDVILLIAVIEHIFNQKHLFKEIIKSLKPGGKIVMTTPTPFGNDIIHRFGGKLGLFSKVATDDHIVIFNKKRLQIVAKEFGLKIEKYQRFQLGCNQLVVLTKK